MSGGVTRISKTKTIEKKCDIEHSALIRWGLGLELGLALGVDVGVGGWGWGGGWGRGKTPSAERLLYPDPTSMPVYLNKMVRYRTQRHNSVGVGVGLRLGLGFGSGGSSLQLIGRIIRLLKNRKLGQKVSIDSAMILWGVRARGGGAVGGGGLGDGIGWSRVCGWVGAGAEMGLRVGKRGARERWRLTLSQGDSPRS